MLINASNFPLCSNREIERGRHGWVLRTEDGIIPREIPEAEIIVRRRRGGGREGGGFMKVRKS